MNTKYEIKVNNTDLILRPSAVDSFYSCGYKWGKTFLEGVNHGNNSRAAIGTAIHAGIAQMWEEVMSKQDKEVANLSAATDAAITAWKEETADGVVFDDGEDNNTAAVEIVKGTEAFIEDIMPFSVIPQAVEKRYTIELSTPMVKALSGTVDYITTDTISDVKTSKRKITTGKHVTQQSIYTMLAKANGVPVKHNLIQGIVLKKQPEGEILTMQVDEELAKFRVNGMLDVLDAIHGGTPAHLLLRGNPSDNMCSPKYCSLYNNGCPYVRGEAKTSVEVDL